MDRRESKRSARMSRRRFLQASSVGAGLAFTGRVAGLAQEEPNIPRRTFGRTDLEVSEISFGSYGFSNPAVLSRALDIGMNLIDTAPQYGNGQAEKAVGEIMKTRRDEAYIITKWVGAGTSNTAALLEGLNASLERLQTDHVDVIQAYQIDDPALLDNEDLHAAFDQAKQAGKARLLGFSAHGGNLPAVLARALEIGKFDAAIFKYNFVESPPLDGLMNQAAEKKLGVVAMKSKPPGTVAEPAITWALSDKRLASVCVTCVSFDQVNRYAALGGQRLQAEDRAALDHLAKACEGTYCRYCGTCMAACAEGVRVDEIMRYAMYHRDYGYQDDARRLYAMLAPEERAAACALCPGPCTARCPHGLPTQRNLIKAHRMLA